MVLHKRREIVFAFLFCGIFNALNFYLLSTSLALPNYYVTFYFFLTQGALAWLWIDFTFAQFEQPQSRMNLSVANSQNLQTSLFQGDLAPPSK